MAVLLQNNALEVSTHRPILQRAKARFQQSEILGSKLQHHNPKNNAKTIKPLLSHANFFFDMDLCSSTDRLRNPKRKNFEQNHTLFWEGL